MAKSTRSHKQSEVAAESEFREPVLTPSQEIALNELTSGRTLTAAAVAAGVNRCTLHRWLQDDSAFAAAYHGWQIEMKERARARLVAASDHAVEAVLDALAKKDPKTALFVLKNLGMLDPVEPGSTDAQELEMERLTAKRNRQTKLVNEELMSQHGW